MNRLLIIFFITIFCVTGYAAQKNKAKKDQPWDLTKLKDPKLLHPKKETIAQGTVLFEWEQPRHLPPKLSVEYTLRVSEDKKFNAPDAYTKVLNQPGFIMPITAYERLNGQTRYYWCVETRAKHLIFNDLEANVDCKKKTSWFQTPTFSMMSTATKIIGTFKQAGSEASMDQIDLNTSRLERTAGTGPWSYSGEPACLNTTDPKVCMVTVLTDPGTVSMEAKVNYLEDVFIDDFPVQPGNNTLLVDLDLAVNTNMNLARGDKLHPHHIGPSPDLNDVLTVTLPDSQPYPLDKINVGKVRFGPNDAYDADMQIEMTSNNEAKLQFMMSDAGITCGDTEVSMVGETNPFPEIIPIKGTVAINTICDGDNCHDPYEE
jgi:hypothetical protein